MSETVTWCGHCGKEEKDHPEGKMCWKVMQLSALGVHTTDPKVIPPEEATLMSEMLRQKERADAAETEARRWREGAETWERRFNAERSDWRTAIDVANATELSLERDRWEVESEQWRTKYERAEADAKTAMERVERLTWEANGAKMGGEM